MCKYCDNQFDGENPIVPLVNIDGGIELVIENGFLYAYCPCGKKVVTEIDVCPKCGTPLGEVKPLTVEQLREKDAKPIFVVSLNGNEKTWCIMSFPTDIIETEYTIGAYMAGIEHTWYSLEDYGKTWTAFDREPKGEAE